MDPDAFVKQIAEIEQALEDIKQQSKNHSSVLSVFLSISNFFDDFKSKFAILHNAHNLSKYLHEKDIYNLVPNHSGLDFKEFFKNHP